MKLLGLGRRQGLKPGIKTWRDAAPASPGFSLVFTLPKEFGTASLAGSWHS